MKKSILAFLILLFTFTQYARSADVVSSGSPNLVVHLLDYLANDYGGAVQEGKVISKSEYREQIEFSEMVEKNARSLSQLSDDTAFMMGVAELQTLIRSMGSAEAVSKLARKLQQDAIRLAEIDVAPTTWPDVTKGATLFKTNCVSCHGREGRGDGVVAANLDPKPTSFHDQNLIWNSAPYKFYNTIRLGVPGTGMAAFSHLSDEEVWALAFYLKSIPHLDKSNDAQETLSLSLKETATLTDAEIAERMGGKSDKVIAAIGSLRTSSGGYEDKDPLQIANEFLDESLELAKAGNFEEASSVSLRAYLEGIEPLEPKMKANLPGYVEQIETLMSEYRSLLSQKESFSNIEMKKTVIAEKLKEAKIAFSKNKMSSSVVFGAAFSIFLREGFEAVLIIVVLISILRSMGEEKAIKWVHFGWGLAVSIGIVVWFVSGVLLSMSGLSRELLEGVISLFAVAVLLYVGFWLHRYSEMKKWRAFLESKLRYGLSKGSYFALAAVAFMAVFREAFEVILFLRAIWIDLDSSGQNVASMGVFSSFLLLGSLSYFAVRESKKLPLGLLFQVCSWTMILLAFILAGKGTHSLQEAGIIPVYSLPMKIRIDLIGIYPNLQTLLAQLSIAVIFTLILLLERRAILRTSRTVD